MKPLILMVMAAAALLACNRRVESSDFKGTLDAYLEIHRDYKSPNQTEFRILKHDENGELVYSLKTGTNFSKVIRIGNICYVSVLDAALDDGNLSLLEINLAEGKVRNTGIRLADDFEITSDSRWICYTYNDHLLQLPEYPTLKSYFPVIYLQRMGTNEKYGYDMISELEDRASFAHIEGTNGAFTITFYTDSPVPLGVGQIDITSHKFTWTKK